MADLHARAVDLRSQGLTERRTFCVLKKEFPRAERDTLVNASRLRGYHTRAAPSWAVRVGVDGKNHPDGSMLHPVVYRALGKREARMQGAPVTIRNKRKETVVDALTIKVAATDLQAGDYLADAGLVKKVLMAKGLVAAYIGDGVKIVQGNEQVVVHLEDHGDAQ